MSNGCLRILRPKFELIAFPNPQILELLRFFGHSNLRKEDLAGLLSEFGYTGDRLRSILCKAEVTGPPGLSKTGSLALNLYGKALEQPVIARVVPQSAVSIDCSFCIPATICFSLFWIIIGLGRSGSCILSLMRFRTCL